MNIDMFQEIILRVYNRNDFISLYCTCKKLNKFLSDKNFLRDKLKGSLYNNMIPYNVPVSGGYVIRRMKKFKDFIKYHRANFYTPGDKGYDEISVFCAAYNNGYEYESLVDNVKLSIGNFPCRFGFIHCSIKDVCILSRHVSVSHLLDKNIIMCVMPFEDVKKKYIREFLLLIDQEYHEFVLEDSIKTAGPLFQVAYEMFFEHFDNIKRKIINQPCDDYYKNWVNSRAIAYNIGMIPGNHKKFLNALLGKYMSNVPLDDVYFTRKLKKLMI